MCEHNRNVVETSGWTLALGGGGYLVWKRVPTAVQPMRSSGCCGARWLQKGGCPLLYCKIRELSKSWHPIFYII